MENAVSLTTKKKTDIKKLFYHKNFTIIFIAKLISRFGDSLDSIAFGWMIYILTGSKLLLGTILAVSALPNIIFSPFMGVFVDRFKKKNVLIIGCIGQGFLICLMSLLFLTKSLNSWEIFVITFLNSTLQAFSDPAFTSIIPLLLPKELFLSANSYSSSGGQSAEILGLVSAGSIIALIGVSGAIFIDGITFIIAAILIFFITLNGDIRKKSTLTFNLYFSELKEGFTFIKNNNLLIITILLLAAVNFCISPVAVILPSFVKENLKNGPQILSILEMCITIGMIIGGLLVGKFGSNFKISTLIITGFTLLAVNLLLLFIPGNIIMNVFASSVLACIFFSLIGASLTVVTTPVRTYFITITPKEILGRVSSVLGMICSCANPLGNSLTGLASQYISNSITFLLMGIPIFLISFSLFFNKNFRNL